MEEFSLITEDIKHVIRKKNEVALPHPLQI